MEEADDVVVKGEGAGEMDEVGIGGACTGVAQDPAGGGVDEEMEGVQLGHVLHGHGEDAVEAGEERGDGIQGDVKGAHVACDVWFPGEERDDGEVAGRGGRGDMAIEDGLCDGAEAGGGEGEGCEGGLREEEGDGEEELDGQGVQGHVVPCIARGSLFIEDK